MGTIGRLGATLALWALAQPALCLADYQSAVEAYEKKQYDVALEEFRKLAAAGHANSQYNLGIMYENAQGTSKSAPLAYAWMRIAAANGSPQAGEQMKERVGQESAEDLETWKELSAKFGPAAVAARWLPQPYCPPVSPGAKTAKVAYTPPQAIKITPPSYPRKSMNADLAGWTVSLIYVAKDGRARDVRIVEALPRGRFDRSVIRSLMHGSYAPADHDGKAQGDWGQFAIAFAPSSSLEMAAGLENYLKKLSKLVEANDLTAQYVSGVLLTYASERRVRDEARGRELIEKAARGGLADAQAYFGLNVAPSACTDPASEQLHFIHQGAIGAMPAAQLRLAQDLADGDNDGTVRWDAAMFWLERALAAEYPPAMRYGVHALVAWSQVSDPARALSIGETLSKEFEYDPIAHELRAYAHAAAGNFAPAALAQQDAIRRAKQLNWNLESLERALAAYREGRQRDESPLFAY